MEIFKFVGSKNDDDLDKERANKALLHFRAAGKEKLEGEAEKTEFELESIRTTNQIIKLIFKHFGIEKEIKIERDQVHFLKNVEFVKQCSPENYGEYFSVNGAIYINIEKIAGNKAHLLSTLVHEALHAVSEQYFFVDIEDDDVNVYDARVGLRTSSQWKKEGTQLRGLNEFIVNSLVYHSLSQISDTLENRFGITKEDINSPIYSSGADHADFFEKIVQRMIDSGTADSNFIHEVVRSHFNGSLKILGKIDKEFGTGSLRVLGYLDCYGGEKKDEINALVEEYFLTANAERKNEILRILDIK